MRLESKPRQYTLKTSTAALMVLLILYTVLDVVEVAITLMSEQVPDVGASVFWRMLALIPVLLMAFMLARPRTALRTKNPGAKNILLTLLLAFFAYMALTVLLEFLAHLIVSSGRQLPTSAADELLKTQSFTLNFLLFCVFAPITEEILFRGMLQNSLEKKFGWVAFVLAGLLFGWMHGEPLSILNGVISGFIMGYIYMVTRSIWVPMLFHAVYNLLAFTGVADMLVGNLPWTLGNFPLEDMHFGNINFALYSVGLAAIGILMSFVLLRLIRYNNPKVLSEKSEVYRSEPGTTPLMVISLALLAARSIPGILLYVLQ